MGCCSSSSDKKELTLASANEKGNETASVDGVSTPADTGSPRGDSKENENDNSKEADYILNIISCSDVPQADILQSESDPYIKFWIETQETESNENIVDCKSEEDIVTKHINPDLKHSTPFRVDCGNPVWNYVRRVQAKESHFIHFELWDKDFGSESQFLNNVMRISDDFLGQCCVQISNIRKSEPFTISFNLVEKYRKKLEKRKDDKNAKCLLNISLIPYDGSKFNQISKTIIFIRHGESQWNEAQEKGNVFDMMRLSDHPLNKVGINQALKLNKIWQECKNDESKLTQYDMSKQEFDIFMQASKIYSSPLTRAAQTALITLMDHPCLTKHGIILERKLREIKGLGGKDTLSQFVSSEIRTRVINEIVKEHGKDDDFENKLKQIAFDYNDASDKWWTTVKDDKIAVNKRFADFLNYIRYVESDDTIICVGHSLFLRAFFRRYLRDPAKLGQGTEFGNYVSVDILDALDENNELVRSATEKRGSNIDKMQDAASLSDMADEIKSVNDTKHLFGDLQNKKIENAGVVMCKVLFDDQFSRKMEIVDAKMWFGANLV